MWFCFILHAQWLAKLVTLSQPIIIRCKTKANHELHTHFTVCIIDAKISDQWLPILLGPLGLYSVMLVLACCPTIQNEVTVNFISFIPSI